MEKCDIPNFAKKKIFGGKLLSNSRQIFTEKFPGIRWKFPSKIWREILAGQ
jgi:hypothetical protein